MTDGLLETAIPRGLAKAIAADMHLCPRMICRWRAGEEASPVDRYLKFQRALYLNHPEGAAIVYAHVEREYARLRLTHGHVQTRRQSAAKILKEAAEAVNAMNLDFKDNDTMRELMELRAAVDNAIDLVERRIAEK